VFPPGGFTLDAGYPLTFLAALPLDVGAMFPTIMPEPEQIVYNAINDACNSRLILANDGQGAQLPNAFNLPPDISLFKGLDPTYSNPVTGQQIQSIRVTRGWPVYPGQVPAIGVAESTSSDDPASATAQSGFAGDVYAVDQAGNVLATCAYYAEPLYTTVVVELIHTNRGERDRLHDQLRRVIFPLRHIMPSASSQIREVSISAEKQDVPVDEQPIVMFVSLFTIEVWSEALIPTEIVLGGVVQQIVTSVTPYVIVPAPYDPNAPIDLT